MSTSRAASRPADRDVTPVSPDAGGPQSGPRARDVLVQWLAAFVLANIATTLVLLVTGQGDPDAGPTPTWVFALAAPAMWMVYLVFVRRHVLATGAPGIIEGVGLRFRPSDAWGILLGIASQLVLVNLVNWPLSRLFPGAFDPDKVSERARDLVDAAGGAWMVVLALIVVVGAPLVEEIVYRGMVQSGLESQWGARASLVFTAILFAAVHLVPVEFPGLLSFALVLGWARLRTGRLGLPVVTHMAFNATGLAFALLR